MKASVAMRTLLKWTRGLKRIPQVQLERTKMLNPWPRTIRNGQCLQTDVFVEMDAWEETDVSIAYLSQISCRKVPGIIRIYTALETARALEVTAFVGSL